MEIQRRILIFVTWANWILFAAASIVGLLATPFTFALGIVTGGLLVTVNFHLLHRTLKSSLRPPHLAPVRSVLAKYYLRFVASGVIIFALIAGRLVDPIGLLVGLSVVVASIFLATLNEIKLIICKEAV